MIHPYLSKKRAGGVSEILLRIANPRRGYDFRVHTGVRCHPAAFRRGKIAASGLGVDDSDRAAAAQLAALVARLAPVELLPAPTRQQAERIIQAFHFGQRPALTFSELFDLFLDNREASGKMQSNRRADYSVLRRDLLRWQSYNRLTSGAAVDLLCASGDDIATFFRFLSTEYTLLGRPAHTQACSETGTNVKRIKQRSSNGIAHRQRQLRALYHWLAGRGDIAADPFVGFEMTAEKYLTSPVYLTLSELGTIASVQLPTAHLRTQRDVFLFQCCVGCRVSDLRMLTTANITSDGVLVYCPRKTRSYGAREARVPLTSQAVAILGRYATDAPGPRPLLPTISPQRYNDTIKDVLQRSGITRMVEVQTPGGVVLRPLCSVASSHLARRTFVANLYLRVQDPALIGKMSGHAPNSAAFSRYRKIEDETLRKVLSLVENERNNNVTTMVQQNQ